jgi:hypothetical protein
VRETGTLNFFVSENGDTQRFASKGDERNVECPRFHGYPIPALARGGFVDPKASEADLAAEAAGAFKALVDALAALQRDGLVRGDDPEQMARFVWAVVHGVAMLGIDGRLREAGGVEELMRYALQRLQTGVRRDTHLVARHAPEHGTHRVRRSDSRQRLQLIEIPSRLDLSMVVTASGSVLRCARNSRIPAPGHTPETL